MLTIKGYSMKKKYNDDLQGNLLDYCLSQEIKTISQEAAPAPQERESQPAPQETKRRLTPQEKVRIGIIPKNYRIKVEDVFDESTREDLRKTGYSDLEIIELWFS